MCVCVCVCVCDDGDDGGDTRHSPEMKEKKRVNFHEFAMPSDYDR